MLYVVFLRALTFHLVDLRNLPRFTWSIFEVRKFPVNPNKFLVIPGEDPGVVVSSYDRLRAWFDQSAMED